MRRSRFSHAFRFAIGGLAAALGLGATTAHIVAASAEPATSDDHGRVDPAALPAPGTYQSCTAKFGLHKYNSDLATFDIVQGANPITPTPVMGTDIVPIVTVSDGTTTVECEAVLGWTDESTYNSDYIAPNNYEVGTTMPYPGTGFYLLPAMNGIALFIDGMTAFYPTTRTIAFPNDLPTGSTITPASANPPAIQAPFQPYSQPSPADLTTAFFTRLFAAVTSSGSSAQANYLETQLTEFANGQQSTCNDQDPVMQGLVSTLTSLGGDATFIASDCGTLINGALMVGDILDHDAQVAEPAITITVSGPAPSTTTTSTTTPSAPVVPTITG